MNKPNDVHLGKVMPYISTIDKGYILIDMKMKCNENSVLISESIIWQIQIYIYILLFYHLFIIIVLNNKHKCMNKIYGLY